MGLEIQSERHHHRRAVIEVRQGLEHGLQVALENNVLAPSAGWPATQQLGSGTCRPLGKRLAHNKANAANAQCRYGD